MQVRLPSMNAPRPLGLVAVAVVGLAIGLAVAKWGMEPERRSFAGTGTGTETESGTETGSGSGSGIGTGSESSAAAEAESESESGAESGSAPPPSGRGSGGGPASESETATGAPLRFVRGRIAYLRCDGVARGGARDCPRDEAMEDAVWAALATLATCERGPRAAGEGDLRLAWEGAGAADVLWRDTFADDVVRLDRDAVLECVAGPLAATRQTIGAERLFVSFRFRME